MSFGSSGISNRSRSSQSHFGGQIHGLQGHAGRAAQTPKTPANPAKNFQQKYNCDSQSFNNPIAAGRPQTPMATGPSCQSSSSDSGSGFLDFLKKAVETVAPIAMQAATAAIPGAGLAKTALSALTSGIGAA